MCHLLCCMQMLFTGGFDVLCYELGPGKVMVTMQRGWNAVGVKDFLLEQPEVCGVCGLRLCALVCVFTPRSMPMQMPLLVGVRVRVRGSSAIVVVSCIRGLGVGVVEGVGSVRSAWCPLSGCWARFVWVEHR